MNQIDVILGLNIGLLQKLEFVLVILGFKDAARIDIYKFNTDPKEVKQTLWKAGLEFENMKTSGQSSHICGLAVAKSKELAIKFKLANEESDYATVLQMSGEPVVLPIHMPQNGTSAYRVIKAVIKEAPTLFIDLFLKNQIIAA